MAIPLGPKQRKHSRINAAAVYFGALSPRALGKDAATDGVLYEAPTPPSWVSSISGRGSASGFCIPPSRHETRTASVPLGSFEPPSSTSIAPPEVHCMTWPLHASGQQVEPPSPKPWQAIGRSHYHRVRAVTECSGSEAAACSKRCHGTLELPPWANRGHRRRWLRNAVTPNRYRSKTLFLKLKSGSNISMNDAKRVLFSDSFQHFPDYRRPTANTHQQPV